MTTTTTATPATSMRKILLGRQRELAELEAGLDELLEGRGELFLVTGEPGIGKTRLCDELGRIALGRGVAAHWGRAWETGGAPSYWPFIQVLRSICRRLDADARDRLIGPQAAALAPLLPEVRQRSGVPAEVPDDPASDRFQLFDAVSTFLRAASARGPLLLVFDDLHAADPSSLLLLQFVARDLRAAPLMVVGTHRDAEARLAPEVGPILTALAREGCALPLRRLDRHQVADFVAQAMGAAPAAGRVEELHQRTEGNPLFLREILQLRASAARPPEGIRQLVLARLALLAPPARDALGAASVLGREFELEPFAALAGTSAPEARALVSLSADAGIVEPLQRPERWRFTHVLLREGLYQDLPAERRASLHRAVAVDLRRRGGEPPLAELAHHLWNAVPAASPGEAADAAIAAADRAVTLLAFEDACALLARTVKLLEETPGEEGRLCQVLLALGVARIRAGDVTAGRDTCRRAAALARRLGDDELFARAVLGSACEFVPHVRDAALIALLEEALASLPPASSALRARCMAQLAAERQPEPDTGPSVELARAAVAMARRLDDLDTLRFTLSQAGLAIFLFGDPAERLAVHQECLRLALAAGDKLAAQRVHLLLGADCLEHGDLAGADAHLESYQALVQLRHSRYRWVLPGMRAMRALWHGHFEEAERRHLEAAARWHTDEGRGVEMIAFSAGFCRATERYHDLPGVESRLRAAFGAIGQDLAGCLGEMLIAQLQARAGDRQRAAAQLATVQADPVFPRIREASWLALLVEPCHLLGDGELAARLYPALLPRARRFFWLGPLGTYYEPPYSRQLGLLARTLGRPDEAVEHLADAEARTAAAGMRSHLARLRLELADALLARAAPGDRERAAALLDAARSLAEELGQQALLPLLAARGPAAAAARGGDSDRDGARAAAPAAPTFTLRREGEYWTVACGAQVARLRDSRGLQVLDRHLTSPGQELHVLQLVTAGDHPGDPGDAGPLLDEQAIQTYRRRLLEVRDELEEAERFADSARAARAREEVDLLTAELARAVGLGGRARRTGGAAERARTTVQKRLRGAIRRIGEALPELGRHLERSIRTGAFCGYLPDGRGGGRRR